MFFYLVPYSLKAVTLFSTPSESIAYLRGVKNKKTGGTLKTGNLKTSPRYLSRLISRLPVLVNSTKLVLLVLFLVFYQYSQSFSATLRHKSVAGDYDLNLTLEIDGVKKLAGLKVTIVYADAFLQFQKAVKTKPTTSFMHVVNDKHQGMLIVVMASASGISGTEVPLLKLHFSKKTQKGNTTQLIEVTGCQLMTEDLHEVPCEAVPYEFRLP